MAEHGREYPWLTITGIFCVVLLLAGGPAVHRLRWSQEYAGAGLVAAGDEIPGPPPVAPWRSRVGTGPAGPMLLYLAVGLLFFAVAGRLLCFILWSALG